MQTFILVILIVIFIILGRFIVVDTLRSKNQKKFLKDMENFNPSKPELKK